MTGTEMIDAIAHIDEDLIDGCLARMKARVSERQALAAAEASAEHLEKPSSPFKMAALTFGAVAAAVVIMLGLISILHIGGKSPQPVGPVVTDSPAPTESATEAPTEEPTPILTPVDTFAEEILSVPVKWYSYDELSASPELGEEMTYLESIEDMEMVHYSPEAFCVTDDGEIAIVDTIGARLCVYDLASGQLKRSAKVGEILETPPIRAAKYDGVYYVLIPYYDSRIVAVYPDGTTSEIPVPQLKGMLEYSHVSEFYAEDGRLILTLIGPSSIETKAVSLSDGSVTGLYSTQWTLENDTFTVTRNGMRWSFPAEPSSGVRSTRIDVLKVGENGELYIIQEVPIEGQDDMGLYQIYDKDGRLLRCEKIDYFMDSYMTADGGRTVGPDDYLYEMHCDEDAVRIIRIVPAEQTAGTEPMTLGGGHTANFTYADKLIFVDFELPEGYELRTEKGDEKKLPLNISPDTGGYIYSADGRLVGCFTAYPYDEEAADDEIGRIYAEFLSGHWHIMLDEMYEPIAEHGTVHPALTLSEGVEVIGGQAMGENPRFTCDALIAYDTASHTKLELAFLQGELDRGQLTYIAESIALSAEDRSAPKAAELDFDSCAELVLRLPWGNGEKEVFMQPASTDSLEEYIQVIPEHFNVIDGKVYIFDLFRPYGKGIIACDPETGNIERLSPDIGENALEDGEFAVMGGKLIFQNCMYDLSTGERTEIENALNRVLIMNVLDGKCIACNAVNAVDDDGQEFLFTQATFAYDVFELDMENLAWVQKERVEMPESVPHIEPPFSHYDLNVYSRGYTEVIGRDDGALFFFDRYMGTDNAGNHYVDSVEESADKNEGGGYTTIKTWRRIIKLSPEGVPVSYVDVSYPDNYLFSDWGNYLIFKVDGDGMVWYMCETKDEVLIYKIDLGNASAPDDTPEPTTASTEAPTPAPEIPEAGILTEVLRVGIGNADDQLGLDTSFEGIGPETFMIFDDSVAVLDSVKQRVCIFENGVLARTIDLAPANPDFYGYCMARLGDRLFVLNTFYGDDVYEFDYLTGEVLNSYPVPDGFQNNASCDLFVIDSVIYIGARSRSYELVPLCDPEAPGLRLIELSATESEVAWSTPYAPGTNTMEREADTFYHFINSDSYGNAYFRLFKMLPDMDGYICGENWLIRCAPTGEITGYAGIPNELCARLPHIDTVVLPDGRVYEMMCTETEVVIYEVTFGNAYESRTDELREFYRAKLGLD